MLKEQQEHQHQQQQHQQHQQQPIKLADQILSSLTAFPFEDGLEDFDFEGKRLNNYGMQQQWQQQIRELRSLKPLISQHQQQSKQLEHSIQAAADSIQHHEHMLSQLQSQYTSAQPLPSLFTDELILTSMRSQAEGIHNAITHIQTNIQQQQHQLQQFMEQQQFHDHQAAECVPRYQQVLSALHMQQQQQSHQLTQFQQLMTQQEKQQQQQIDFMLPESSVIVQCSECLMCVHPGLSCIVWLCELLVISTSFPPIAFKLLLLVYFQSRTGSFSSFFLCLFSSLLFSFAHFDSFLSFLFFFLLQPRISLSGCYGINDVMSLPWRCSLCVQGWKDVVCMVLHCLVLYCVVLDSIPVHGTPLAGAIDQC